MRAAVVVRQRRGVQPLEAHDAAAAASPPSGPPGPGVRVVAGESPRDRHRQRARLVGDGDEVHVGFGAKRPRFSWDEAACVAAFQEKGSALNCRFLASKAGPKVSGVSCEPGPQREVRPRPLLRGRGGRGGSGGPRGSPPPLCMSYAKVPN